MALINQFLLTSWNLTEIYWWLSSYGSANGSAYGSKNYLSVLGYFEVNFEITRLELVKFYVTDGQQGNLMSIDLSVLTILNEIKKSYTGEASEAKSIADLVTKY